MLESLLVLGRPVNGLNKHIRILTDKSKVYNSSALVKYDLSFREKAEIMGPCVFVYGNHELVYMFLDMDAMKPKGKGVKNLVQSGGNP